MTGPKRKVARRFLLHEPERESEDSDSDGTKSDTYDDMDYVAAFESD